MTKGEVLMAKKYQYLIYIYSLIIISFSCSNNPPEIISLIATPDTVLFDSLAKVECVAEDSDNDKLNYEWSSFSGTIIGSGNSVNWKAPNIEGNYSITCKVSDNEDNTSRSVDIDVVENIPNLTKGLIGYYPFNGNSNDFSGNDNHLTEKGASLTLDRNGNTESAYFFDGNDKYLEFADPSFLPIGSSPRSFSFWINTNNQSSVGSQVILQYGTSNQNSGLFQFGINNIDGSIYLAGFNNDATSGQQISIGVWHFVCVVYTGSPSEIKFYLNGNEDIGNLQTILNTSLGTYRETIGIGGEKSSNLTDGFNGTIDEVRIYDRALTNNEIELLYME